MWVGREGARRVE
uniref:Uncharacterized protein n=1 Tax=Arundo donax TaxID=35708 RepID=A0A0A8XQ37_ARUDO